MDYPEFTEPETINLNTRMLVPPIEEDEEIELEKGPNIQPLPLFYPLPDILKGPVLLKVGNDISTDEIMPAGSQVLPFRSNIPEISKFVFNQVDPTYYKRAIKYRKTGSVIVGGKNYGQGSSREHAALAPRYLGVKVVIAINFARIHFQNLANFGILPLEFVDQKDWNKIEQDDVMVIENVRKAIQNGKNIIVTNRSKNEAYKMQQSLTPRQVAMVLEGSLINVVRKENV
jgi:aconitate hydratase